MHVNPTIIWLYMYMYMMELKKLQSMCVIVWGLPLHQDPQFEVIVEFGIT